MRISDWSSDVCSSDLNQGESLVDDLTALVDDWDADHGPLRVCAAGSEAPLAGHSLATLCVGRRCRGCDDATDACVGVVLENVARSEERRVWKECVSTFISRWAPKH